MGKLKLEVLNLYAGIGGNRKLWKDAQVTAVEHNKKIAKIYQENFPDDSVIIGDAHKFLLNNFEKFQFIWSSPPCPSHSRIRKIGIDVSGVKAIYPEMSLYQEIIFLQHYFKGKWCVENVVSFYEPLIKPQEIAFHYFWANFRIPLIKSSSRCHFGTITELEKRKGFNLSKYNGIDKRKILRNCVESEVGKHILDWAFKKTETLNKQW